MNEFDQFMKHIVRVKNYVRYTDDFAIVSDRRDYCQELLPRIVQFLETTLALYLHPKKIILRPFSQGMDFLGYVLFPTYRLVRPKTRRRIFRNMKRRIAAYHSGWITKATLEQSLQSYLGILGHANAHELREELLNQFWFSVGGS